MSLLRVIQSLVDLTQDLTPAHDNNLSVPWAKSLLACIVIITIIDQAYHCGVMKFDPYTEEKRAQHEALRYAAVHSV